MVFKNNFIAVIKNRGRILREDSNNVVKLPFGSEYSILLKNKDSRKAVARVEIDGAVAALGVIVFPNKSMELFGFLEGLQVKNRFKFIKKTKEIQNHRGDRVDDGIIRIEYRFEAENNWCFTFTDHYMPYYVPDYVCKRIPKEFTYADDTSAGSTQKFFSCDGDVAFANCSTNPRSDEGITVKGSHTHQRFFYDNVDLLEKFSSVIIINLKGDIKGKEILRPVTVKTKFTCPTCGRRCKSNVKFCGNCGTYLF